MEREPNASKKLMMLSALSLIVLIGAGTLTPAGVSMAAETRPLVGDPVKYVDPFIGTGEAQGIVGEINNFPGPSMPFGMMQLSPDTVSSYAGYRDGDEEITGFSSTHASAGCRIFGDLPILPFAGEIGDAPWDRIERFDKESEAAEVGRYAVTLTDSDVDVELSAQTRSGGLSFDFNDDSRPARVSVDASGSFPTVFNAGVDVVGTDTLTGTIETGQFCSKPNRHKLYYAIEFDTAFSTYSTWQDGEIREGERIAEGHDAGAVLTFPAGSQVKAKVALSYVDVEGAQANLDAEIPGWNFEKLREQNRSAWHEQLSRIRVSSTSDDDLTMFYTLLYQSLLHPNTFSDVDGRYIGFDGEVHTVEEGSAQYANFSDWDTYRSLGAMQTLIAPDVASDLAQSLVNAAKESGWLPRWPVANQPTGQMTGDSVVPLIASIHAFGGIDFDVKTALEYMVKGATSSGTTSNGYMQRRGIETYLELEYAPQTSEFRGDHATVGASITQEWSIADFAIAQLADKVGEEDTVERFLPRAQYWKNVFDPEQNTMSPRSAGGEFVRDESGSFGQEGFDEGNSEQYLWMVPQNIAELVDMVGGREAFTERLDAFTEKVNAGPNEPNLWIGNEPNFGVPWLYNYVGQPEKTSQLIDRIIAEVFEPTPDGKPGNDDLGAQAGWYVWAALGMYPVTPGTDELSVNAPRLDRAVIDIGDGKTLTINAPGASEGRRYIESMTVDGRPWNATWLPTGLLEGGGVIDFTLDDSGGSSWGTDAYAAPMSFGGERQESKVELEESRVTIPAGMQSAFTVNEETSGEVGDAVHVTAELPQGFEAVPGADAQVPNRFSFSVDGRVPPGSYEVPLKVEHLVTREITRLTATVIVEGKGETIRRDDNADRVTPDEGGDASAAPEPGDRDDASDGLAMTGGQIPWLAGGVSLLLVTVGVTLYASHRRTMAGRR